MPHGGDERMHCTAIFQVADQIDIQVFERALCLVNRVNIEQTLRRVHMCTIAGIDNRYRRYFAGVLGCPLNKVAHDDNVGVVAHHQDGVFQRFALGGA